MPGLVEKVRKRREKIWVNEPGEVGESFLKARGTGDSSFFPCLYGDFEARACHHALYTIRQTLRDGDVDFKTIRIVTKNSLNNYLPYLNWPRLYDSEKFIKEVAEQLETIESEDEFIRLLEELALYVGRLNYWIDQHMPWYELIRAYEAARTQD
ncbi:MAG: hypothetical protein JRH18_16475 [Deltaproteobacteria bacterium]|nr:hypothetical protein [Deltaproteobacteria bacterium]MBW1961849.1 hypothetical protein [Deltaproteobacteria bacterium]MBW2153254.1 hypothetical protein [Deltaproteobacteria bacterium]